MSRDIKTGSIRLRYRYFSGSLLKGYEVIEMFDSYILYMNLWFVRDISTDNFVTDMWIHE